MEGQVYMIRHNVTNKVYIGKSKNPERRFLLHLQSLRRGVHSVEDLQADFDKFGDNMSFAIIGDGHSPGQTECELMDKYQSCNRGVGYNYKDPHTRFGKIKKGVRMELRGKLEDFNTLVEELEEIRRALEINEVTSKDNVKLEWSNDRVKITINGEYYGIWDTMRRTFVD